MVQYDTTGSDYYFPTEDSKRKSYYSVHVKERKDKSYNIYVCHCTETSIIEESYWTDYTYDCTSQVYDNETDTWETAQEKDCKTNNMPLE